MQLASSSRQMQLASDLAVGSQINAAGSINLVATGADKDSNILIQGSDLKAAKDIALAADKQIQLLASRDSSEQHSQNSGRSGSVGIGFQLGGSGSGLMLTASASGSRGHADGTDVAYRNTPLNAGENVRLSSGGDAAVKGAVVAAKSIDANIGGHLAIESLQDTTHYDSAQQSLGGSVSVGFGMMGGSVSYAKSKIDSDFRSVGEQSGLLAGDGGFNVKVAGDTTLKGAVITSTDAALQAQNNHFETGGTLAMSDLHNHAEYAASSVSVSVGTSVAAFAPSGSSMGFGNGSGSADSESRSGISGIAGNQNARTGDAQTGLKPIFDADKVQQDIDAQTQITQSFGQQASKLVGDYAGDQAQKLKMQADAEKDPDKRAALLTEAAHWGEGGAYRVALHAAVGGLSGGIGGAAGSASASASAPMLSQLQNSITDNLKSAGLPDALAKAAGSLISSGAATAVGSAVGGTAGAAMAFNEDVNNRQLHPSERQAIQKYSARFAKKLSNYLGRNVSSGEAERWLAEAAFANVDEAAMKAMNLMLPANAASEERQAYNQAKQYLFQIQAMEQNATLFSEKNPALYKNNFAGRDVNDSIYREFVWKNYGINERPANPNSHELDVYNARENTLKLNAAKNIGLALIGGVIDYGVVAGANKYFPVNKFGVVGSNEISISPSVLKSALDRAVPTTGHPNQLMTVLEDGTKVIFRKDFGANAHAVGGPYQGQGNIDHYNIEIQVPKTKGVRIIEDVHIVPDGNGGYVWWGKNKEVKK
jgi:filamentous hemagglutinin